MLPGAVRSPPLAVTMLGTACARWHVVRKTCGWELRSALERLACYRWAGACGLTLASFRRIGPLISLSGSRTCVPEGLGEQGEGGTQLLKALQSARTSMCFRRLGYSHCVFLRLVLVILVYSVGCMW